MTPTSRRTRAALAGLALLGLTATTALQQLPATAADTAGAAGASSTVSRSGPAPVDVTTLGDSVPGLADLSLVGKVAPLGSQAAAAAALPGVDLRWNDYGTPASILPSGGSLGRAASGDAVASARTWLGEHADLFGLPAADLRGLDLVDDHVLAPDAHVVLLQQRFGGLAPARGSLVTVGIANGQVAYVSSTLARATGSLPQATLSPLQGWLKAASDVGITVPAVKIGDIVSSVATAATDGFTRLQVPGLAEQQLVRPRFLALADGTLRPVLQSTVLDSFASFAYTVLVDGVSGKVLSRQNQVDNLVADVDRPVSPISGSYSATTCGTSPIDVTDDATKTIAAVVTAGAPVADDITLQLLGPAPANAVLASADTLTSPELLTYSASSIPKGAYTLRVCAYEGTTPTVPTYAGNVTLSNTAVPSAGGAGSLLDPKWRFFTANPRLDFSPEQNAQDNSVVGCWSVLTPVCTAPNGTLQSITTDTWDTIGGVPTFTTSGNNAVTHEAWVSPLTPGGLLQAPISPTRDYSAATPPTSGTFTDAWNNAGCAPTNLVPGGNDINAVTGNLFVGHNQIHDWSYALGFTESAYNLQLTNGSKGGVGGDPEIGNVQAGALIPASDPTGGMLPALPVTGRDNANQITMMDGVAGITNQYLFQPLAGAFYSPCADGSLDTSIFGHEYTHAISTRMIGGPDGGIDGEQGGAMGESWGDLNAGEYMFANNYVPGPNPWAVGPYATGNPVSGIRDYPINANPLNYSDYGFDTTGAEVHADGEIWNGTQWEVRDALATAYDSRFRYADTTLQKKCSKNTASSTPFPAEACPGNRRWIQLVYDAFLLQQSDTDMLTARDAMIAADRMRFGGADVDTLWAAFARRGMGQGAQASVKVADPTSTTTPPATIDDVTEPVPSFATPGGPNSAVTFSAATGSKGKVYVGDYEARATPVADTDSATALGSTVQFTPGRYTITYVSPTNGFRRLQIDVPTTGAALAQVIDDSGANLAAAASGATIIPSGTSTGSLNPAYLIDGTEATTYGYVDAAQKNIDELAGAARPSVAVDLAGTSPVTVSSVKLSALLSPAPADPNALPVVVGPLGQPISGAADPDPTSGSRFTALRKFEIQTCLTDCSSAGASWSTAYTSGDAAFPGDVPRPVAPNQTLRTFNLPTPVTASAVRLVSLENQCTGQVKYADASGPYGAAGSRTLDLDPLNATDCRTGSDRGTIVHASELQVFGTPQASDPVTPGTGVPGVTETGQGVPGATTATSALPTATPAAKPGRATTRVRVRLPRVQQVRSRESTPLAFAVVSKTATSGGRKAGRVTIKIDGKKVKTFGSKVALKSGRKVVGKTYRIPSSLAFGAHRIQVFFRPFDTAAFSTGKSRRITLTVVRSRPRA